MTLALHKPAFGKADTAFLGKKGREMGKKVTENYTETKSGALNLG